MPLKYETNLLLFSHSAWAEQLVIEDYVNKNVN